MVSFLYIRFWESKDISKRNSRCVSKTRAPEEREVGRSPDEARGRRILQRPEYGETKTAADHRRPFWSVLIAVYS
ncbi:hypothetical protein C4552_01360 [Candidatus Parcubacteria bacterium]|nr:MAG: hypothetical protein C4552_01360 [Candidatus Parcubacteria bacterium]